MDSCEVPFPVRLIEDVNDDSSRFVWSSCARSTISLPTSTSGICEVQWHSLFFESGWITQIYVVSCWSRIWWPLGMISTSSFIRLCHDWFLIDIQWRVWDVRFKWMDRLCLFDVRTLEDSFSANFCAHRTSSRYERCTKVHCLLIRGYFLYSLDSPCDILSRTMVSMLVVDAKSLAAQQLPVDAICWFNTIVLTTLFILTYLSRFGQPGYFVDLC